MQKKDLTMIKEISGVFPLFESVDSKYMPRSLFDYSFRYIVFNFWENCHNDDFMEDPASWGNMLEMTDETTQTDYLNVYGLCRYNIKTKCKSGKPKRGDLSTLMKLIENKFSDLYAEYYYMEDHKEEEKFKEILYKINQYSFEITIGKGASSRIYDVESFIAEEFFQSTYERFCNEFLTEMECDNKNLTIH